MHAEKVLQRATQESPWLGRKNTENRQRESLCSGAEVGGWPQGVLGRNSGSLRSHGNLTRVLGGGLWEAHLLNGGGTPSSTRSQEGWWGGIQDSAHLSAGVQELSSIIPAAWTGFLKPVFYGRILCSALMQGWEGSPVSTGNAKLSWLPMGDLTLSEK